MDNKNFSRRYLLYISSAWASVGLAGCSVLNINTSETKESVDKASNQLGKIQDTLSSYARPDVVRSRPTLENLRSQVLNVRSDLESLEDISSGDLLLRVKSLIEVSKFQGNLINFNESALRFNEQTERAGLLFSARRSGEGIQAGTLAIGHADDALMHLDTLQRQIKILSPEHITNVELHYPGTIFQYIRADERIAINNNTWLVKFSLGMAEAGVSIETAVNQYLERKLENASSNLDTAQDSITNSRDYLNMLDENYWPEVIGLKPSLLQIINSHLNIINLYREAIYYKRSNEQTKADEYFYRAGGIYSSDMILEVASRFLTPQ